MMNSYPSKGRSENRKEKEQYGQKEYEITQGVVRHKHVVRLVYLQVAHYD